jgi:pimeloyl-ACP methyl ester carboxylesterase
MNWCAYLKRQTSRQRHSYFFTTRIAALMTLLVLCPAVTVAQNNVQPGVRLPAEQNARCARLLSEDFTSTEDAPTTISSATPMLDAGNASGYCQVEGVIAGATRFIARFPLTGWNGKMVVVGSGAQAGSIMDERKYVSFGGLPGLVARGYGFIAHDSGHKGGILETNWGVNNRTAMIDYGYRAGHLAGVIGKEVLKRFYGRAPIRAYYHSCSNGGREAMMMAQRYPWDYDGIVAAAPAINYANQFAGIFWLAEQMADQSRVGLDPAALRALHKAVLAQCDKIDGVADGILDDPRRCRVKLRRALCKNGAAEDCLTQHQIVIATKIYEGPRRSDGSQIAYSTVMAGSELKWNSVSFLRGYVSEVFRDLAFDPAPGPDWKPESAKLGDYVKRMGLMESLFAATNPDLRAYRNRGGKLLAYFGWTDVVGGLRIPMDYYDTVERVMGGQKATRDFFRLFMMPGMDHCTGGEGAWVFDYLGTLDRWVETGRGPDVLEGYHPNADGSPQFYRTVKPYSSTGPRRVRSR